MAQIQEDNNMKTTRKHCSLGKCSIINNKDTLVCHTCKRLVHHDCTLLPEYQLILFLTNDYSEYTYYNCVYRLFNLSGEDPFEEKKRNQELTESIQNLMSDNKIGKAENVQLSDRLKEQEQKLHDLKQIHHECKEIEKLEIKINEKISVKIKNIKESVTKELTNNIKEIEEKQTKKIKN